MSADRVLPGGTEQATLVYHAPARRADDQRVIEIRFEDVSAPVIRLEIKASIRPAIVLGSDAVQLNCTDVRSPVCNTIDVENCSVADWNEIALITDQPWLTAAARLVRCDKPTVVPRRERQLWNVELTANARPLKPGRYSAELRLTCHTGNRADPVASAKLPVGLHVTGPIEFVPDEMFFGNLDDRGTARCTVWVRCISCTPDVVASDLTIEHDMGDWLSCEVARCGSQRIELQGTIRLPKPVEAAKGVIKLSLDGDIFELPVRVLR